MTESNDIKPWEKDKIQNDDEFFSNIDNYWLIISKMLLLF